MKATEVNEEIIGKRCKSVFTGMMVTGVIEKIKVTKHTAEVKVRFDEPHQWGDDLYKSDWSFARLSDGFGSLQHLEIIDEGYKALSVTFREPIREINRKFVQNYRTWEAVNLKEWIDRYYPGTRFTQIDDHRAIITSEYNLECIEDWLNLNTPVLNIKKII